MESFYGGRPGASFIIVKTYSSFNEMVTDFQRGAACTDVHFDEYVMISVDPNSNVSPEQNGRIYRRGYNYSDENTGGAEFIGTIAGPPGELSTIDILNFDDVTTGAQQNSQTLVSGVGTADNGTLVLGKDGDNYNDTIIWQYYEMMVQDENTHKYKNHIKLGFKIPCPVFDFDVQFTTADNAGIEKIIDNEGHLFYHKWKLKIPAPQKGDTVKAIEIIKCGKPLNNESESYGNENVNYNTFEGTIPNDALTDSGFTAFLAARDIDINNQQTENYTAQIKKSYDAYYSNIILAYKIVSYDPDGEEINSTLYYLDDYPIVKNIDISDTGYLIFTLPDGTKVRSSSAVMPSLNNVIIDKYGRMFFSWQKIDGSITNVQSDIEIPWVENMKFDQYGNFKIYWNTLEKDTATNEPKVDENNNYIKKITNIDVGGAKFFTNMVMVNGALYVTYLGIQNEIMGLITEYNETSQEKITFDGLSESNLQKMNVDTLYYKDVNEGANIWYKKIFDIDTYINKYLENSSILKSIPRYTKGNVIDETIKTFATFVWNCDGAPGSWSLTADFTLSKPVDYSYTKLSNAIIGINFPDAQLMTNYNENGKIISYTNTSSAAMVEDLGYTDTWLTPSNAIIFGSDSTYTNNLNDAASAHNCFNNYINNHTYKNLLLERFKLESLIKAAAVDSNGSRISTYNNMESRPWPRRISPTLIERLTTLINTRFIPSELKRNGDRFFLSLSDDVSSTISQGYNYRLYENWINTNRSRGTQVSFTLPMEIVIHKTLE